MNRYKYPETEARIIEKNVIPMAVYQYLNKQVVTILLSDGFLELFDLEDREAATKLMDDDMYRDAHPDDIARISDAAVRFATNQDDYNVTYRSMVRGEYKIIHAFGKHIHPEEGVTLAVIWYVDEGIYKGEDLMTDESVTKNYSISLYEAALRRQSNYDFLTGIPNMTHFFEIAQEVRAQYHDLDEICYIGFANLNGMKFFNKKHGFSEGNNLLRTFANILVGHFGSERCCRIGQDNFAFIASKNDIEENINLIFEEMAAIRYGESISVRVGLYVDDNRDVDTSLVCDRARYACNTLRNNTRSDFVYYDESMMEYEQNRQYILDNLDRALEERWILAYYQPIVRTANGKVCDEEALARWVDPVKGMLSPAEFIPALEDSKLIYKLDLYMVDRILERMKIQMESDLYPSHISVNLSRTDFDACDIVDEICTRVDAAGISRDMLTIEITESVIGKDFEFMKTQVERFQSLGFQVWMDDFGSGYSSLDTLQNIHFDVIKLDMRFMKQFDSNQNSRVIITELIKMALGLEIETVMEGVERKEQVDFLKEIGCTKIQGYYYCRPVPYKEVVRRNKEGIQIGFENPEETEYYTTIGRINLYDISVVASDETEQFNQIFNTLPMAIVEAGEESFKIVRCNTSYSEFLSNAFGDISLDDPVVYDQFEGGKGSAFAQGILQCSRSGNKIFIDEKLSEDATVHAFIRKLATNPVTHVTACAVVVLGIIQDTGKGVTYADIANSLSADYLNLYYVNLETESFVEYTPDPTSSDLSVERRGTSFFLASRQDALQYLYRDDVERFVDAFTKENVLKSIDENGAFTITYRLLMDNKPVYVNMKAIRMSKDNTHIIIGVNNVDAQMRQQEAMERIREEKIAYDRIAALSADYICIYTVDPETDKYMEYGATEEFEGLGVAKFGSNFFEKAREENISKVYEEDQAIFRERFTKENVIHDIEEKGLFVLHYRIMINDVPTYIALKGGVVQEKDGPQLIIGVVNIDEQMRRNS